jgi:hypothetical protein
MEGVAEPEPPLDPPGTDVLATVSALLALDVGTCDHDGLDRVLRQIRRVEGWLAVVTAAATRQAVALHASGRGERPDLALQRSAALSRRSASSAVGRAATLAATPTFAEALEEGAIGAAHVDALRRAVDHSPALARHTDTLLEVAARTTPDEFARRCQEIAVAVEPPEDAEARFERQRRSNKVDRWLDRATGMYRMSGAFDPETGERIWTALDAAVRRLFSTSTPAHAPADPRKRPAFLTALALADLVAGTRASGRGAEATIVCTIDHETLLRGLHDKSLIELPHGGCLPVGIIRRMACEAGIIPVVLGGDSVPLDVGRRNRLATPDQRRTLQTIYPTCAVPGCTAPFSQCDVHHVAYWGRDVGTTSLATQAPLCDGHHNDVHLGRIVIELHPTTRAITVRSRDGAVIAQAPGPPGRRAA